MTWNWGGRRLTDGLGGTTDRAPDSPEFPWFLSWPSKPTHRWHCIGNECELQQKYENANARENEYGTLWITPLVATHRLDHAVCGLEGSWHSLIYPITFKGGEILNTDFSFDFSFMILRIGIYLPITKILWGLSAGQWNNVHDAWKNVCSALPHSKIIDKQKFQYFLKGTNYNRWRFSYKPCSILYERVGCWRGCDRIRVCPQQCEVICSS